MTNEEREVYDIILSQGSVDFPTGNRNSDRLIKELARADRKLLIRVGNKYAPFPEKYK